MRVFSPVDTPWVTVVLCLPLTLTCAWLSHRFVEAPALRLKTPVTAGLRRVASGLGGTARCGSRAAGIVFSIDALAVLFWPRPGA